MKMKAIHGGDIYRNHVTIDFSVNVNPLGMPKAVEAALHEAVGRCGTYPDMESERLKHAVSQVLQVPKEHLLFGNGASELFMAVIHGIRPKKTVIPVPSFYGYEYAAEAADGEVLYYETKEETDFCLNEDFFSVLTEDKELVFLANPNNPTGTLLDRGKLERLLCHCRDKGIFLVLDECFIEFCDGAESAVGWTERFGNLIVVRAFTKIFSIPGVRLGYLVCSDRSLLRKIGRQLPEWNISSFAQAAGYECALQAAFARKTADYVKTERQFLENRFKEMGIKTYPASANFLLLHSQKPLYEPLLERGILIRDCWNFRGLSKGFYRVAVKNRKENEVLLEAVRQILYKIEPLLPDEIEKRSFAIIAEELGRRGISLLPEEAMVTMRAIHASADFDYGETMAYSRNAVAIGKELLLGGADIVTDTNMALAGINKKILAKLGGKVHCFMADEDVARQARERGMTRAAVSMEKAREIKKPVIFAVGNAPTALIRLCEMMEESDWRPALVIGVPVGFVNVEAAKEWIMEANVPYIVNRGRKGGSNVAAAICNALLYELERP